VIKSSTVVATQNLTIKKTTAPILKTRNNGNNVAASARPRPAFNRSMSLSVMEAKDHLAVSSSVNAGLEKSTEIQTNSKGTYNKTSTLGSLMSQQSPLAGIPGTSQTVAGPAKRKQIATSPKLVVTKIARTNPASSRPALGRSCSGDVFPLGGEKEPPSLKKFMTKQKQIARRGSQSVAPKPLQKGTKSH
jgi:hypothetical protein